MMTYVKVPLVLFTIAASCNLALLGAANERSEPEAPPNAGTEVGVGNHFLQSENCEGTPEDKERCIQELLDFLERSPVGDIGSDSAWSRLHALTSDLDRIEAAKQIELLRRALSLSKADAPDMSFGLYGKLARAYVEIGEYEKALDSYREMRLLDEEGLFRWYIDRQLARVKFLQGRHADATKILEEQISEIERQSELPDDELEAALELLVTVQSDSGEPAAASRTSERLRSIREAAYRTDRKFIVVSRQSSVDSRCRLFGADAEVAQWGFAILHGPDTYTASLDWIKSNCPPSL